ncbi:wax ester/triacylglycerol synthase family O-acyltransferase [Svornostia abyssi]|uniref:Diacylglycerol O-acyltransferase n=1 Tax=Svornostia abyssi TaxID=2898438 RepID=A0ABY5PMT1_9ACTN|nr:wax ester/triacylglycerol synthase family O-acyltransferase [Parviterribacteraceae bacterium J379]
MEQLTSLDAQFLAIEDGRVHGHICGLLVFEPGSALTRHRLCESVAAWTEQAPVLRRRVATAPLHLAHPFWEDGGAPDLAAHVHTLTLPQPGGPRELADEVARIHGRALDRTRPLWDMHLIDGLEGDGQALLIKAHHATMDGVAGLAMLLALDDADGGDPATGATPSRTQTRWARTAVQAGTQPLRAARVLPRVLPHLDHMPMTRCIPGAGAVAAVSRRAGRRRAETGMPPSPRTSLNSRLSSDRSIAFGTLPLEAVHAARAASAATVNDVVVSLVAGALRRWLRRRGELPATPLIAMVPVSLRPAATARPAGNAVTSMLVAIPTDEPHPVVRLERASRALRTAKARSRRLPATLLDDANTLIPPAAFGVVSRAVAQLAASERVAPPCNLVISNLPGPAQVITCAGAPVRALYPVSAIADGVGLNITVVSYAGRLHVGVVSDQAQMPDPEELAYDLESALVELAAGAVV